jgi:hypothetical protein
MTKSQSPLIGGKTVEEWDRLWRSVEGGLRLYHPKLRHQVGLYRALWKGQIVAIGAGTDKSGGLAKRLSDFRRPNASGREHYAGRLIYEHRDVLEVEVLITGSGNAAREVGRQLKTPMIRLHRPVWTAPNAPFMREA